MNKKNIKRRSNWYIYLISFAATFVLLGLVILALRDTLFPQNVGGPLTDWRNAGNYIPPADLDTTILFMLSEEQGSTPDLYMLLNYRPRDGVIVAVPLHGDTGLVTGGESWRANPTTVRISELYESGGGSLKVMEGIKNTLDVDCDFYVRFDRASFTSLVSALGDVQVNIPFAFSGGGINLPAGEQKLSGGDLFMYIYHVNFPAEDVGEDYRLSVLGSAAATLINFNCRNMEREAIQDAFNKLSNNADTNLTFKDYTHYQQALSYTSENSISPASFYVPTGGYEGGSLAISGQSKADILNRFKLIAIGAPQ